MPANIFERIADDLGLPSDRSEKLVRAMIREIRKRARKGRGVKIPNLGSFSVEDGRLTFSPAKSLAQAVNQRFEGLGDEQVALPELDEQPGQGEGPTTITRGFDMGAWDPLDTGGSSSASGASSTSTPGGADTDEFQISQDSPDTDEFELPAGSDQASSRDASGDDSLQEADSDISSNEPSSDSHWDVGSARSVPNDNVAEEEPVPNPNRMHGEETKPDEVSDIDPSAPLGVDDHRSAEADDDAYDSSGFSFSSEPDERPSEPDNTDSDEPNPWAADSAWDFSTVTSSDVEDADDTGLDDVDSGDEDDDYPSYRPPDADEQEAENQPSRSIFDFDEEEHDADAPKREAPKTTKIEVDTLDDEAAEQEKSSSSAATVISVIAILFLALAGGWIVLGHQGIVPTPERVLGLEKGLTSLTSPSTSNDVEETPSTVSSPTATDDAVATDTESTDGETNERAVDEETDNTGAGTQRGFDPNQGGYTIAVASRSTRSGAQAMVEQFRRNLADTNLPVDIVSATANGTTRYRVGVGQFSTRAQANEMRRELQTRLPDGAWPVPIDGE